MDPLDHGGDERLDGVDPLNLGVGAARLMMGLAAIAERPQEVELDAFLGDPDQVGVICLRCRRSPATRSPGELN